MTAAETIKAQLIREMPFSNVAFINNVSKWIAKEGEANFRIFCNPEYHTHLSDTGMGYIHYKYVPIVMEWCKEAGLKVRVTKYLFQMIDEFKVTL